MDSAEVRDHGHQPGSKTGRSFRAIAQQSSKAVVTERSAGVQEAVRRAIVIAFMATDGMHDHRRVALQEFAPRRIRPSCGKPRKEIGDGLVVHSCDAKRCPSLSRVSLSGRSPPRPPATWPADESDATRAWPLLLLILSPATIDPGRPVAASL